MTIPTVSIIVPCRNEKDHIHACVRSILAQDLSPEACEIIVADGMSDDGTRDILQQLAAEAPRLRVIDNLGRIVSTGLNTAIREARGAVIVRMDAHTEYASDYVRQCLAVLQETGADNVGGPARTKSRGALQSAIGAAYHSPFAVGGARFHDVEYEGYVDTVPYGCWPRKVFEQIGLFDEELLRNQDDELNLRLIRMGGKIWQSPRIESWYRPRSSLRALCRQYMHYGYWKVPVIQKHRLPPSVRHLVPGSFVLALLVLPLLSLWWPGAVWAWLGLVGLYGGCNIGVSLRIAARQAWGLLPLLPLVFACYHVSYGYGFLRGVWDFVLLQRGPSPAQTLSQNTADRVNPAVDTTPSRGGHNEVWGGPDPSQSPHTTRNGLVSWGHRLGMTIPRANILGVGVSAVDMAMTLRAIEGWIARREPHYICVTTVHGVMESQRDENLRRIHNAAGLVTPDGMPLVWLSRLMGFRHVERVYGPDLMLALCERSTAKGYRQFFYGGGPGVAEKLAVRLQSRFPGLKVAGTCSPPFRPLTAEEDRAVVERINAAQPDIVWVGISTPKQERWMAEHVGRLSAPVLVGVGAAFDFQAGLKRQAPRWMQKSGLEWLFRLLMEPRRLWRRYLLNNPWFLWLILRQALRKEPYALE
jgi:exopolysaccharide biosynthesis WecB/TagA/CpsF family protein